MAYSSPSVNDFKTQFIRDFPFAVPSSGGGDSTDSSKVLDADITNALTLAGNQINPGIFTTQALYTQGYLYLAAHYLVTAFSAAFEGVGSSAGWLTASKSVGSVSESYAIPDRITKSPFLALLSKTKYGSMYLQIVLPLLVGNVQIAGGATLP